jgi:hypothetical protein
LQKLVADNVEHDAEEIQILLQKAKNIAGEAKIGL